MSDGLTVRSSGLSGSLIRVSAPLREQVVEIMRNDIAEMRLLPGQRLIERELIEYLGVSRTTVREALRELTAEGLVTMLPQKGAVVTVPSAKMAAEVYEVRALLEGALAREFVARASELQVAAVRSTFNALHLAREHGDPRESLRIKRELYDLLYEGAQNSTIKSILKRLEVQIAVLRAVTIIAPGRMEQSLAEIGAVVEAIERGDAEAAERHAGSHVRHAAATLFAQLRGTDSGHADDGMDQVDEALFAKQLTEHLKAFDSVTSDSA